MSWKNLIIFTGKPCAGVSLLTKLHSSSLHFIKKILQHRCFPFLITPYFVEHVRLAASGNDTQQQVIKMIERPGCWNWRKAIDIGSRNQVFSYKRDELVEFWWSSWRNYRTLTVNNFISVDFQTHVSIWFLISMRFCTRIIN